MSPMVKRIVAAVAIKKAVDYVQEKRRPEKRSLIARLGGPSLALGAAGGVAYLAQSGRLRPVIDQIKGLVGFDQASSQPAPAGQPPSNVPVTTG